jgi:tetratricopeptide (TPR) repeat protein
MKRIIIIMTKKKILFCGLTIMFATMAANGNNDIRRSDSLFMEGIRYHFTNQNEKAFEAYYLSSNINPDNYAVYYEISRLYKEQGRMSDAIVYGERAFMLAPKNKYIGEFLATMYAQTYQFEKAADVYLKLVNEYPENLQYAYQAADAYINIGNLRKAISVYDNLEKCYEITDDWVREKVKLYMALGDKKSLESAKYELEKASKAFPKEVKYYEMLAEMAMNSKDYKEAEKNYRKIIEIDSSDELVHFSLADYYRKIGDNGKSYQELIKGVENPKIGYETVMQVVSTYFKTNDVSIKKNRNVIAEQTDKVLQAVIRAYPDKQQPVFFSIMLAFQIEKYDLVLERIAEFKKNKNPDMQINHTVLQIEADILFDRKEYGKSFAVFDTLLLLYPEDITIKNNYAYYLSLQKVRLDFAETLAAEVCQKEPNNATYLDTYGWIFYVKGDYEKAKEIFERAMKYGGAASETIKKHYNEVLKALKEGRTVMSSDTTVRLTDTTFSANIKCVVSGLTDNDVTLSGKVKISATNGGWISLGMGIIEALRIRFHSDSIFIINKLENSCIVEGGVPTSILSTIFMGQCDMPDYSLQVNGFSLDVKECTSTSFTLSASFNSNPIILKLQYQNIEKNKFVDMPFRLPAGCK